MLLRNYLHQVVLFPKFEKMKLLNHSYGTSLTIGLNVLEKSNSNAS